MLGHRGLAIAAALALMASRGPATADTFDATSFTDAAGGCAPGGCSLRQAVLAANASVGADTILLHAGTYRLTLRGDDDVAAVGDLDVLGVTTIEGDSAGGTFIDAKRAKSRAFEVFPSGDLTLRHVTIRGGSTPASGGAIYNVGTLTVENSTFTGNKARVSGGAISGEGGTCTLTDVVLTKNKAGNDGGGCEFNVAGTAALTRVTISRNKAADTGGGMDQDDGVDVTIADSTVAGNKSKHEGGGLDLGIGTTTLTNTTLSGNKSVKGGGFQLENGGIAVLTNVTITGNKAKQGGGIWTEAGTSASPLATLVAKNKPFDCFGPIDSRGSNLIGRSGGCTILGVSTGNRVGGAKPLDPLLGPLAANGGPTATHALLPGSPAIDAVAAGCPPPATDQRGLPRVAPCDIGAFEVQ